MVGIVVVASGVVHMSPSWRGIGATVASILVLGGLAQAEASPLSRLLSLKPMAYLGRISYGTYLWHWPVIVALGTWLDAGPLPVAVLAFAIATGLAALSAELLELPIRRNVRLDGFTWPVVVAGLATSALVAATIVPNVLERDQKPVVLAATSSSGSTLSVDGALTRDLDRAVPNLDFRSLIADHGPWQYCSDTDIAACRSVRGAGPTVLLVGDSQAQTFIPVFKKLARQYDFNLDLNVLAGCPLAGGAHQRQVGGRHGTGVRRGPASGGTTTCCHVFTRMSSCSWTVHVMIRRSGGSGRCSATGRSWVWTRPCGRPRERPSPRSRRSPRRWSSSASRCPTPSSRPTAWRRPRWWDRARSAPSRRPHRPTRSSPPLAIQNHRIHALDLNPVFCPTRPVCSPIQHDQLVWRDDHHYTVSYAKAMRQQVWSALKGTGAFEQQ